MRKYINQLTDEEIRFRVGFIMPSMGCLPRKDDLIYPAGHNYFREV